METKYFVGSDNKAYQISSDDIESSKALRERKRGITLEEVTKEAFDYFRAERDKPKPLTIEQVYALRATAYADPQTGSDRHFAEAARKRAEDDTTGAAAATQAGLARAAEIKAEYPLP